jgi:aminomethyltransferase
LIEKLNSHGAVEATADDLRLARVENRQPRYGEDFSDSTLPQETQMMHALHFSKGCYLGQEIVERIRSRGNVHRLLVGMTLEAAPAVGAKIEPGGEITSSAVSPRIKKAVALGYVRADRATAGSVVEVEGQRAEVTGPPPAPRG